MYLVSFFAIFALLSSTISLQILSEHNKDKVKQNMVGHALGTGYSNETINTPLLGMPSVYKGAHVDKEMVTKVLLRTCAHLYAKSILNGCPNAREPSTVWSFAGVVNNTGNLGGINGLAWKTGSISNTFSCGNISGYGRKLIREAIPKTLLDPASGGKGFMYDFTGMSGASSGRTDPCGYNEIVYLP